MLPKKKEKPVEITPLTLFAYFLLKTVYKLKVNADRMDNTMEYRLVEEDKSALTKTPAEQRQTDTTLIHVMRSFRKTAANKMVNTELEEKTIAINAGESALRTAYCSSTMLMQMHSTPNNAILT